jgi:hypothetical protein
VERNLLVGQLSINSSIGISATLNVGLVTSIKVNLKDTTSINLASGALSGDLGGVDNVLEDGILDGSQGTRAGAQSLGLLGTGIALSKDVTLGNNDEVFSRELLLQLADEASLDLLEGLLELVGHVNNGSLASGSAVNFLGGKDEEVTEGGLELGGGELEVEEFLGDLGLEFIGFLQYSYTDNISTRVR